MIDMLVKKSSRYSAKLDLEQIMGMVKDKAVSLNNIGYSAHRSEVERVNVDYYAMTFFIVGMVFAAFLIHGFILPVL